MANIKVAVRIRPLSQRESDENDGAVVWTEGKCVIVTNPKIPEKQDGDSRRKTRKFEADFAYDAKDPETSSQEFVYKEIGLEILETVFEGFNACVLAYGHSASGKTYTMMGSRSNPGLTPRICEGLFQKMNLKSSPNIRYEVFISFLEIYNEKVRDLLGGEDVGSHTAKYSLRIREHPKLGPYVQDLSHHWVSDANMILEYLNVGSKRRSTATTENNIRSSRSHAVFTVQIKQSDEGRFEVEKASKVYLVDLAGSEKASSTQSRTRLKEGANINKSLVTLGNVISALAENYEASALVKDHSRSRTWQPFVPYRDSVLTWLLKDTLGGNSNTIMIATISPASSCLSETINTLRYARRTKRIVNQPIINEDPKIRTIRELRKEVERLRKLVVFFREVSEKFDPESNFTENDLSQFWKFKGNDVSKWLDSGGTQFTRHEESNWNEEKSKKSAIRGEEEEEVRKNSLLGSACGISDGKESDVNGSVIDNLPHETSFFTDSLESFSWTRKDSGEEVAAGSRRAGAESNAKRVFSARVSERTTEALTNREYISSENLKDEEPRPMLHRIRPDLIKEISVKSKEKLPPADSYSCTDLSISSQSTGENSIGSSGNSEMELSESKYEKEGPEKGMSTNRRRRNPLREGEAADGASTRIGAIKKDKRSEIVEAVTSRLYAPRKNNEKKSEEKEVTKDWSPEEDGEIEELKLCKRARMKLFDMSRKLAMTKKLKKTVNNDTQTEFRGGTIRMKEKSVVTDHNFGISLDTQSGGMGSEEVSGDSSPTKSYLVMNQVFLPNLTNCSVKCDGIVEIGVPKIPGTHESSTQTFSDQKIFKNVQTSPVDFFPDEEDSFSDDSLNAGKYSELSGRKNDKDKLNHQEDGFECLRQESSCRSYDSLVDLAKRDRCTLPKLEKCFSLGCVTSKECSAVVDCLDSEKHLATKGRLTDAVVGNRPSTTLRKTVSAEKFFKSLNWKESYALESRREENFSSENSFVSVESTDLTSSSGTSSEDFVFYENPKDKEAELRMQVSSDRELYTITENSDQSEAGEAFSPVRNREFSLDYAKRSQSTPAERLNFRETSSQKTLNGQTERQESSSNPSFRLEDVRSDKTSESLITIFLKKDKNRGMKMPKSKDFAENHSLSEEVNKSESIAQEIANGFPKGLTSRGVDEVSVGDTTANWKDLQQKSNRQFLHFNILDSPKTPFSIDTPLFTEPLTKNQSPEAFSASQDSITFVFMGPIQPKSSVLMEIIKRSIGKDSFVSEEQREQQRSKSRGVQCSGPLLRSVSVDTALVALTRIAKNQESSLGIRRTGSLDVWLNQRDETSISDKKWATNFRETGCQCNLENEFFSFEENKGVLKYSVSTITCRNEETETVNFETKRTSVEDKPKKTVSWFQEANREVLEKETKNHANYENRSEEQKNRNSKRTETSTEKERTSRFDLKSFSSDLEGENRKIANPEAQELNFFNVRKDRFSKIREELRLGNLLNEPRPIKSSAKESMTSFIKEATQLLKKLNHYTEMQPMNGNCSRQRRDKEGVPTESTKRNCNNAAPREGEQNKSSSPKRRLPFSLEDLRLLKDRPNLTWPRRRTADGKPPTGTKANLSSRCSNSQLLLRHTRAFSNFFPVSKNCSLSNRGAPSSTWVDSNSSTTFNNSFMENMESRASSCRSLFPTEYKWWWNFQESADVCRSPSPDFQNQKSYENSVSDLKMNLEKSCRRLEFAAEQDNIRQKASSANFSRTCEKRALKLKFSRTDCEKGERVRVAKKPVERRSNRECVNGCTCSTRRATGITCNYFWSHTCGSSFELDSFGPGSNHCLQHCMFCRKKDLEVYCSAPSLNSDCNPENCRLHFYGYCPCSSVKLPHVASSPRAYLQQLQALRRRVVNATKILTTT